MLKPLSQRAYERFTGEAFSGPVVAVNPPQVSRGLEDYARASGETLTVFDMSAPAGTNLVGEVVGRLTRFNPQDPELKARLSEKIHELTAALNGFETLEDECREERALVLGEKHEEVKSRARAQRREVARLEAVALQLYKDVKKAEGLKNGAGNVVGQAQDRLTRVDRFASGKHIESLQQKIREAQTLWSAADTEYGRILTLYNQSERDVAEARKVMGGIETEEVRVRGELTGIPYTDPEFGLLVRPQS